MVDRSPARWCRRPRCCWWPGWWPRRWPARRSRRWPARCAVRAGAGRRRRRARRRPVGLRLAARGDRPARAARRARPAHADPGPRRAGARPEPGDQPGRRLGAGLGREDHRHRAVLLAADRRLRLRLRDEPGHDQRARAGRRGQTGRAGRGREYDATPVYVDAQIDIAVLAVPGLPAGAAAFTRSRPTPATSDHHGLSRRRDFFVGAARVRDRGEISGPDFRNTRTVVRDVYALYGTVRAGNSGGPLFAPDGSVLGVVFASAIDDPNTGYALTAPRWRRPPGGATAPAEVDTGPCE